MAYNKTSEERKWNYWKEQEEKKLRELGMEEEKIQKLRQMDREDFLEEFNYFLKRYKDKDLTKELNFRDDKFTEKKAKEFLEDIFANSSEESPCKEDMVKALGYIIYRIRNNYFHGIKPTKSLPSQNENFRNVNRVIINLLETIKR